MRGLHRTYAASQLLPHTMRWDGQTARAEGHNPRYALIALLGLAKGRLLVDNADSLADDLWRRIVQSENQAALSPGDFGLGLWASSLHRKSESPFIVERARQALQSNATRLDSVELAWLLLGASHALAAGIEPGASKQLAVTAYGHLRSLFNPSTSLFYRHGRTGLARTVSRRVPCFANQIYPVMALAHFAAFSGKHEALGIATAVAENLCALQGNLGQWWWLYDAKNGGVVDGYPVFSVHQDGMAPMALAELTKAGGRDFPLEIARSLVWIDGHNELSRPMALADEGLVLRDIHRAEIGRTRRALTATMHCMGIGNAQKSSTIGQSLVVNAECRPYHLGWILYAAGALNTQ